MPGLELLAVGVPFIAFSLGMAKLVQQRVSQTRSVWRAAGDQLGLQLTDGGIFGTLMLRGRYRGHDVEARLRYVNNGNANAPSQFCDVSVGVPIPLPPGLAARTLSSAERVLPMLSRSLATRDEVYRDGKLRVVAATGVDVSQLIDDERFRQWLRLRLGRNDQANLISNTLNIRGFGQDSVETIVRAVDLAIDDVLALAEATMWQPWTCEQNPQRGRGAWVAFAGIEAPTPTPAPALAPSTPSEKPLEPAKGHGQDLMARMVADLAAQGTEADAGVFTLDREAALRKLRSSRVDRREVFVLELLRAASLRGASRIALSADADDLRVAFDGRPFTARELEHVYAAAFAKDPEASLQSCRHLGLALEGALGLAPRFVKLTTPTAVLTRRPEAHDVMITRAPSRQDGEGGKGGATSHFHVKLTLGQRLRGPDLSRVLDLARSHAYFMTSELLINGEAVAQGPDPRIFRGLTPIRGRGPTAPVEGWLGFDVDGPATAPAMAWLGRVGVWVERREGKKVGDVPPGLLAVVMAHDLDTDLSGRRIVDNEATAQILRTVNARVAATVVALTEHFRSDHQTRGEVDPNMARRIRSLCAYGLSKAMVSPTALREFEPGKIGYALSTAHCWPTVDGRTCTLRALLGGRDATSGSLVPFSDISVAQLAGPDPALQGKLWRVIEPHFDVPTLHVAPLSPYVRGWLAATFGDRLSSRTRELLEASAGL